MASKMVDVEKFRSELHSKNPRAHPQERLEVVWEFFENDTNTQLSRPPTHTERAAVENWYRMQLVKNGFNNLAALSSLKPLINETPFSKSIHLGQHICNACEPVSDNENRIPLRVTFPIQIDPWSAQSTRNNAAVKAAVNAEIGRDKSFEPIGDGPLCITISALVPRSHRRKDIDNIAKGLLDSMEGVIYVNDSQIQCLQIRRIEYSGSTGYYSVSARAVHSWDCDIIFDSPADPIILSGRPINS